MSERLSTPTSKGKDGKKGKKGKGGKKKLVKKIKLNRLQYDELVAEINAELADLRSRYFAVETKNIALKDKLFEIKKNRQDIAAYVERKLTERAEVLKSRVVEVEECIKLREQDEADTKATIKQLEMDYNIMEATLTTEIKLLTGKLKSLSEYERQRIEMFANMTEQDSLLDFQIAAYKDALFQFEQNAVVEKDALSKEVDIKLDQVFADFMLSTEIRNASYCRRLIKENVEMHRELNTMVRALMQLYAKRDSKFEGTKMLREVVFTQACQKKHLIQANENKRVVIEQLINRYEALKIRNIELIKYHWTLQKLIEKTKIKRASFKLLSKKLYGADNYLAHLQVVRLNRQAYMRQLATKMDNLSDVIFKVQYTIQGAMKKMEEEMPCDLRTTFPQTGSQESMQVRNLRRDDLLYRLKELLTRQSPEYPPTKPSRAARLLYIPGDLGFILHNEQDLLRVAKRDVQRVPSKELLAQVKCLRLPSRTKKLHKVPSLDIEVPLEKSVSIATAEEEEEDVWLEEHEAFEYDVEEEEHTEEQSTLVISEIQEEEDYGEEDYDINLFY